MGNHEFCTECEESDFHHGRPCNPEKVAAVKERERKQKERLETYKVRAMKLMKFLRSVGLVNPAREIWGDFDHYDNLRITGLPDDFDEKLDKVQEAYRNECGDSC